MVILSKSFVCCIHSKYVYFFYFHNITNLKLTDPFFFLTDTLLCIIYKGFFFFSPAPSSRFPSSSHYTHWSLSNSLTQDFLKVRIFSFIAFLLILYFFMMFSLLPLESCNNLILSLLLSKQLKTLNADNIT